jgi:selenoprotein W-related protein
LAAEIQQAYPDAKVELLEGSGGVFEVTKDGKLLFSKKQLGRHPQPGEVLRLIAEDEARAKGKLGT